MSKNNRNINQFGHKWCWHRLDMGGGTNVPPQKKQKKLVILKKKICIRIMVEIALTP